MNEQEFINWYMTQGAIIAAAGFSLIVFTLLLCAGLWIKSGSDSMGDESECVIRIIAVFLLVVGAVFGGGMTTEGVSRVAKSVVAPNAVVREMEK